VSLAIQEAESSEGNVREFLRPPRRTGPAADGLADEHGGFADIQVRLIPTGKGPECVKPSPAAGR
jgi:hypothetical protein